MCVCLRARVLYMDVCVCVYFILHRLDIFNDTHANSGVSVRFVLNKDEENVNGVSTNAQVLFR